MRPITARSVLLVLLVSIVATAVGACGTTTTPTTPTPVTTTESLSGTIDQLGSATFPFTVGTTGTVTIGLTSVGPLATMALGVGIGTWDGTTCGTSITKNDNARAGATALTGLANAGSYCIRIYDSGNIPVSGSSTFTVEVVHP